MLPPLRPLSEPLVLEERAEYMNASAAASELNLDLFSMDIQRREQRGLKDSENFPLSTLNL